MDLPSEQELRASWQGRALVLAKRKTFAVLLSVLGDYYGYPEILLVMRAVFPGFLSIQPPFFVSSGRVAKSGKVIAQVRTQDEIKWTVVYQSKDDMRDAFRRLADNLQLDDTDRQEMFDALNRWCSSDLRKDPYMDPRDPDAYHLVH